MKVTKKNTVMKTIGTTFVLSAGLYSAASVADIPLVKPSSAKASTTYKYVTTANLNMRASNQTNASIILTIPKGKTVTYVSKSGNWYKVKYNSKTGWVSASYINKIASSNSATMNKTVQTTSNLNMRKSASTSASVLTTIPKGTKVTATAKSGNWYKVTYSGKTGWVSSSYVKEVTTNSSSQSTINKSLQTTANLNVRKSASTSASVLTTIPKGTKVTATAKSGNWYKVTYSGKTGWVRSNYVKEITSSSSSSSSSTNTTTINKSLQTTANLNVRKSASTSTSILTTIPKGTKVTATAKSGNWYKVTYSGKTGWVSGSYVKDITTNSSSTTETLQTTSNLNMRKSASTSASIVTTIPKGTKVTVTAKSGNWCKVTYNSKTGWVSADYLGKPTSSSTNTNGSSISSASYVSITDGLKMRTSNSTSASIVTTLSKGTMLTSTYKTSNGWYKVTYNGKTGYVSGDHLVSISTYSNYLSLTSNKNTYLFMDLRTISSVTAAQINAYIAKNATASNSVLYNTGAYFVAAGKKYGVNALYLAAHAIHESNFGKSTIALAKNNLFGFGAFDAVPFVGAYYFNSIQENIEFIAKEMKATYLNPSNWKYNGAYLGYSVKNTNGSRIDSLSKGMNFYYATDSSWGNSIARHMTNIMSYNNEGAKNQVANTSVPSRPSTPSGNDAFPSNTKAIAKTSIKLYSTKGSSNVSTTMKSGASFYLLEKTNDYWLKVKYNGKTYYTNHFSMSSYSNYFTVTNLGRVTSNLVNVRNSASISASKIGTLSNYQYVELIMNANGTPVTSNGWYKVKYNSSAIGWVSGDYIIRELCK